jgi:hypothetical protein
MPQLTTRVEKCRGSIRQALALKTQDAVRQQAPSSHRIVAFTIIRLDVLVVTSDQTGQNTARVRRGDTGALCQVYALKHCNNRHACDVFVRRVRGEWCL